MTIISLKIGCFGLKCGGRAMKGIYETLEKRMKNQKSCAWLRNW